MSSICRILIFSTLLLLSISAFGQEDQRATAQLFFEQAELTLEATRALDQARDLYVQAAELDTTFVRANFEAGHIHLRTVGKDLAVKYLMRVYRQDPQFRFDLEYLIGKSYQYGLDFDNAIKFFNLYKEKLAKKPNYQGRDKVDLQTVERSIIECENGKKFVANPGRYSIVNIGREINSEYDDYAPVLNEKEDEIVFTSRRREDNLNMNVSDDNLPFEDIFIARKVDGKWTYAQNIGNKINTPYHDSNLALSADGSTLFIFNDENGGDIYYCELQEDGTWGSPIPLPGIINSSFEEKSISISKDEQTLYFTSNRPGGYGGTDIYKAVRNSRGQWSNVKNLGPKINTPFDEDGPFIDYDGVTLYFSSRGHSGMGGHDIYRSRFDPETNEWSEPENLGYPINTPDDDVFFITSPSGHAYYSSVREGGLGYQDIYIITIPEEEDEKKEEKKEEPIVAKNPEPVVEKQPDTPVMVENTQETQKPDTITENTIQPTPTVTENTVVKTEPVVETVVETKEEKKEEPKPVETPVTTPVETVAKPVETPEKPAETTTPTGDFEPISYFIEIIDSKTRLPLRAKVSMQGAQDNVVLGYTTISPGFYEFKIVSPGPKDYRLSVELEGYVFQNETIRIDGTSAGGNQLKRTIRMRKLAVGVTSILRNIYFDFDKATFKTESYTELNKLEMMLRQNPNLKIEIGGHTDSIGPESYNKNLSQKRAEAVKDYLTRKGIDPRRIIAKGYGESKPLASNDDEEEGRELNRRVEFKVISN